MKSDNIKSAFRIAADRIHMKEFKNRTRKTFWKRIIDFLTSKPEF